MIKGNIQEKLPQARKEGLVVQDLPQEVLVYDLNRHKAYCLNETAALIWKCCDGKMTVGQLARAVEKKLKLPVDERVVWLGLKELSDSNLLLERATVPDGIARMSRRQAMSKLGIGAMLAVPVILSLNSPTAAQAGSCRARDVACTLDSQCCSGNCRGNGLCA